jgi:ABC-type uncharacterized transport system auxiliary subunit
VQLLAVCLLAGVAAACSASRPVKYYVLDAPPAPAAAASAQIPVSLVVGRIATSHLYRDDRLVYGSGPVQLGTYEYERWSAPPADMIQDMLISSLRANGHYRSVSRVSSVSRGDYIVRGHLDALDEIDKPSLAARFSLQIELFEPKTGFIVWSSSYSHDEPVQGKQVADVVEALDRNVQTGLQQLTAGLAQYLANRQAE